MNKTVTAFLIACFTLLLSVVGASSSSASIVTHALYASPTTIDSLHDQLMKADDQALAQIDDITAKILDLRGTRKEVVTMKQQLSDLMVKINTSTDSTEKHKLEDQREALQKDYNVESYKQGQRVDSVLRLVEAVDHLLAEARGSIMSQLGQLPQGGEYKDFKDDTEAQFTRFNEQIAGLRKEVMAMRA